MENLVSQLIDLVNEVRELKRFVQQEQAVLHRELTESLKQQIKIQNDFNKYLIDNNSQLLQQVANSNKFQEHLLSKMDVMGQRSSSMIESPLKVDNDKPVIEEAREEKAQAESSQQELIPVQQQEVDIAIVSTICTTENDLSQVSTEAEIDTSYNNGQVSLSEIVDSHQYIEDDEIQGEEYQERIRESYDEKEDDSEATYFVVSNNEEIENEELEKELSLDMKESKESLPADSTIESANSSILGIEAKSEPQTAAEKLREIELNLSPIVSTNNNRSITIEAQVVDEVVIVEPGSCVSSVEPSLIDVDVIETEQLSFTEDIAAPSNSEAEKNVEEATPPEIQDPTSVVIVEATADISNEVQHQSKTIEDETEPTPTTAEVSADEITVDIPLEKKVSPTFIKSEENEEIEIQVDDDDDDSVDEKLAVTAQNLIDLCTLCLISEDNENLRNIDVSYFEFKNALEVFKNSTIITDLTEMIDHERTNNEKPHLLPILFFCRGSILYEMAAVLPPSSQKHLIRDAKQDFTAIIALENQFQVVNDPMYQRFMSVTYFQRSIILENESNFERAVSDLDLSISKYPRFIEAYYRRAAIYKNKFSKYQEALNDLSKIIELNPRDYECYFKRGLMLQNKFKNPELALIEYRKSIELNPNFASAYNNIGILYYDTFQKYELALEYFTKAIEMKENHAPFYKNRGRLYLHKLNEVQKALEDFSKAIELNNQDDESYLLRAWLYEHKLGQLDKAQQDTHKAQEINPKAATKLFPKETSPASRNKTKRSKKERTPKKSPNK